MQFYIFIVKLGSNLYTNTLSVSKEAQNFTTFIYFYIEFWTSPLLYLYFVDSIHAFEAAVNFTISLPPFKIPPYWSLPSFYNYCYVVISFYTRNFVLYIWFNDFYNISYVAYFCPRIIGFCVGIFVLKINSLFSINNTCN